jgi:hypothetical protein
MTSLDNAGHVWRKLMREGKEALEHREQYDRPDSVTMLQDERMYCPECVREMRMTVEVLFPTRFPVKRSSNPHSLWDPVPISNIQRWLLRYTCADCGARFTALVFPTHSATELVVLPEKSMGLSTPRTPRPVAYYLEQAYRCELIGAQSAATAMYRGALEQLLLEQGYNAATLNKNIEAIEQQHANDTGARWVRDLDPSVLRAIKDLGNAAVHANDGNIDRQKILDQNVLLQMRATFLELLDSVCEEPHRRAARRAALVAAQQTIRS